MASPSVPPSSSSCTLRASPASGSSIGSTDGSPDSTSASIAEAAASASVCARNPARSLFTPGLGHLGQQVRKLGQRRTAAGQALERALDAEGDLLEAIEREARQRLARRVPRLGLVAAQDVDEQIDHLRPLQLAQHLGQADQAQRALVLVERVEGERLVRGALEVGKHALERGGDERVVRTPDGALGVEQLLEQGRAGRGIGHRGRL